MTLAVRVQGGTGAGKRPPVQPRHSDWVCEHGHANAGFLRRCNVTGCNVKRPK